MAADRRLVKRLDPIVSSQIAAGEVVERPASVVKELVENSLDAGARRIIIEVLDAGFSLIKVSDNGSGMSKEDACMALERFATSKLSTVKDLECIVSLGFRGEALPSIASCSRMTLETRLPEDISGVSIRIEGGKLLSVTEKGLPAGTTIVVQDLFYNTPARLKFMRSKSREKDAIIEVVERLALAFPRVSFALRIGDRTVLSTKGLGLENALLDVFGPDVALSMIPLKDGDQEVLSSHSAQGPRGKGEVLSLEPEHILVTGYVGLPGIYRRQRDREVFSVNSRPVRNWVLAWALEAAYTGLIPPKTYPVAVIDIRLPAREVDVNVHPTKAEVKFRDEKAVRWAIASEVRRALASKGFAAFELTRTGRDRKGEGGFSAREPRGKFSPEPWPNPASPGNSSGAGSKPRTAPKGFPAGIFPGTLTDGNIPPGPAEGPSQFPPEATQPWDYLGALEDTYLLVKTSEALLIVDKHALAESLAYTALMQGKSGSQELLMPEILTLDAKESAIFEENVGALGKMGFSARLIGEKTILVSAVPQVLGKPVPPRSIVDVLAGMRGDKDESSSEDGSSAERSLMKGYVAIAACHASVRAREPFSREEADILLREFFSNPSVRSCPHGRPVMREIPMDEIRRFFGRTSHTRVGLV